MTDEAYSVSAINAGHGGGPAASRRDFLTLVAGAMGVLGAGAAAYTLIDSMNPQPMSSPPANPSMLI